MAVEREIECPTHRLAGQKFSGEEIEYIVAHASELKVCKNCENWFKKQLELINK